MYWIKNSFGIINKLLQNYRYKYLTGGTVYISSVPCIITTVLGSCVAVVLWDSVRKYGGMNHYLLPVKPYKNKDIYSYGDTATKVLIDRMIKSGSLQNDLKAMIYGASDFNSAYDIWSDNIKVAEEILSIYNIKICNKKTGGRFGRNLKFNTHTGIAEHKFVDNLVERTDVKTTFYNKFPI